jgi:xanthine dehydrogenase accessory factor
MKHPDLVVVRGGGDIATGVVQKLHRAGLRVAILEQERPTSIRRTVALSEAAYDGLARVEDLTARRADRPADCGGLWAAGEIPLLIDPEGLALPELDPHGLVEATLAKRGPRRPSSPAAVVIACGPGFSAPDEVQAVIETRRGHDLGRVIFAGRAQADTGVPEIVAGRGRERVLRAPCAGVFQPHRRIGDLLAEGEAVFSVSGSTVRAPFAGLLRGLLRPGLAVQPGFKIADLDPRTDVDWRSISDKARCIGGGVLEAYMFLRRKIISGS